jgi:flavin reductase (DIM6/NTAB) family NADH-FMN oxidoreductase RutF
MSLLDVNRLFDLVDPPLWVVTASAGGVRGGLIATHVTPVSIVPDLPRVIVALARSHRTWELVEASGSFALHTLDEAHLDWVWRFGLRSGRQGVDKFDGLSVVDGASGAPILADAPAWLDCRVEARLDTGDRTAFLAEVVDGSVRHEGEILRVGRMLKLASPDQLARMSEHLARDIAIDRASIRDWREEGRLPRG